MTSFAILAFAAPAAALAQQSTMMSDSSSSMDSTMAMDTFNVYFGFDKASLDSVAKAAIDQAAAAYKTNGGGRVSVRGFTDSTGGSAYNQQLSERRASAVADELVRLGVDRSSIDQAGLSEAALDSSTGSGQAQAANRRVDIAIEAPPAPAPVAMAPEPAPMPAPAYTPPPAPEPMMEKEPETNPFFPTINAFYGYNLGDGADNSKESHLAGLNLGFNYGLGHIASLSLEQAGFYNFLSEDNGFGGRTAAGIDLNLGFTSLIPYIGANIGALYGSGIEDGFFAGPEVGLHAGPLNLKVAYDMPFNRSIDEGVVAATLGLGLRF